METLLHADMRSPCRRSLGDTPQFLSSAMQLTNVRRSDISTFVSQNFPLAELAPLTS
jgi:hypothetical protein